MGENKKKALLLFLLLSATSSYSEDFNITNNYLNKDTIQIANDSKKESNINIATNDVTFYNSGTAHVSHTEDQIRVTTTKEKKGNGINIDKDLINTIIYNNGEIKGEANIAGAASPEGSSSITLYGTGNGISSYSNLKGGEKKSDSTLEKIHNSGQIIALTTATSPSTTMTASIITLGVGNAISSFSLSSNSKSSISSSNINLVTNTGDIRGEATLLAVGAKSLSDAASGTGNAISSYSTSRSVPNPDAINDTSSKIGNISNSGSIKGELILAGGDNASANSQGSGNAISSYSAIFCLGNKTSTSSSDIGELINSGYMQGKVASKVAIPVIYQTGNGVSSYSATNKNSSGGSNSIIGKVINKGYIKGDAILTGKSTAKNLEGKVPTAYGIGNGISSYSTGSTTEKNNVSTLTMAEVTNSGKISGETTLNGIDLPDIGGAGNGINAYNTGKNTITNIDKIVNEGTISGYLVINNTNSTNPNNYDKMFFSGNGVSINKNISSSVDNRGLIKGSESAVAAGSIPGTINNYGVLAGKNIYSNGSLILSGDDNNTKIDLIKLTPTKENNYGVYITLKSEVVEGQKTGNIKLDNSKDVIIKNITNGTLNDYSEKKIINTDIVGDSTVGFDSYKDIPSDITYENHIINGAGIKKGVLNINDGVTSSLSNTIVNAYKTAVTLGNNSKLSASNTIFNGGGLKNLDPVLLGDNNVNTVEVLEDSIINGDINLRGENDFLSLSTGTHLNGNIAGGAGEDTLTLKNSGTKDNINIFGSIASFEKITIEDGKVTLFETSKITGAKELNIKSGGQLNVRIDRSVKDANGAYTGNALYENTLKIKGDSSKYKNLNSETPEVENGNYNNISVFNIITDGLALNSKINFGKTEFIGVDSDGKTDTGDDLWIKTDTIVDSVDNIAKDTDGNTIISLKSEKDIFSIRAKVMTDSSTNTDRNPSVDSSTGSNNPINNTNDDSTNTDIKNPSIDSSTGSNNPINNTNDGSTNTDIKNPSVDSSTGSNNPINNTTDGSTNTDKNPSVDSSTGSNNPISTTTDGSTNTNIKKPSTDSSTGSNNPINNTTDGSTNTDKKPSVDSSTNTDAEKTEKEPTDNSNLKTNNGILYTKLNDIYKGIYTSGDKNFSTLRNHLYLSGLDKNNSSTETVQFETLLGYLGDIYAYNPYSFSSETSMKSLRLFRNTVIDNHFKAEEKTWLFLGGLTHNDGSREQTYYGKNYYNFDSGSYNKSADTKITGAYAQAEYGFTKTLSSGIIFGGNSSDTKISPSKVEGTSMYLGGYIKKDIENFRITSGIGIQYSEYESDRYSINRKYDSNYSDKSFNIYLNGRYSHKIKENLYFEPYAQLAYTYVDQESTKENDGPLSLNIKSKEFNEFEGTVGADIKREFITTSSKHSIRGGLAYTRILDGYEEDNLKANFGGDDFNLLVPHKTPNEVKLRARYEVENVNGVLVGISTDYSLPIDSKDNGNKNKNDGEWTTGLTIGYKFN
ncbi:MAG: autotransporter domain-containing protein [Fusobacteriaceae bacterium]